ncbi:hypothetical protein Tco_1033323 [Tanacetum coccineum]|uniref:Uncharacterized protein n=1 Tax=Tanacetum coccineum TaxID=301880 RepID=A0ABQ5GGF0_9ASTR
MHRKIKPGLGNAKFQGDDCENCLRLPTKWDVNSATGRYLCTDFKVSDEKGNLMHCIHWQHWIISRLKEGPFFLKNLTSAVKSDGFARYLFQSVEFDSFEPTNNKYLIDAVGYVRNVGMTTTTRSGLKTLDFHLANNRGQSVRVTLWGWWACAEMPLFSFLFSLGVNAELHAHVGHLSCFVACFLALQCKCQSNLESYYYKLLRIELVNFPYCSGIEIAKELLLADSTGAKARTFENLLMWARNQKYDNEEGVELPIGWWRNVMRQLTASMAIFGVTHATVLWTTLYRLKLEVSDDTAQTVVVMFDETARAVVKCSAGSIDERRRACSIGKLWAHTLESKSNSYYKHTNYESFTCWRVVLEEALDESGSS